MQAPSPRVRAGVARMPRHRVRLLLAEPDAIVRDSLAVLLERAGYLVQTAANGDEVLAAASAAEWDGLITDLHLPDIGGVELYARLLFLGRPRFPAVFLSVRPPPTLELGLRGAPWVRLLRKPCTFPSLLAALESCLGAPRGL